MYRSDDLALRLPQLLAAILPVIGPSTSWPGSTVLVVAAVATCPENLVE